MMWRDGENNADTFNDFSGANLEHPLMQANGQWLALEANQWVRITLNLRVNSHARMYVDDVLAYEATGLSHFTPEDTSTAAVGPDPRLRINFARFGQLWGTDKSTPSGTIRFDDIQYHVPPTPDIYVDPVNGHRANSGLSAAEPLGDLQRALYAAHPGTTVHLLPGVYRQTSQLLLPSGLAGARVVVKAEDGPGTAHILNSNTVPFNSWQTWAQHSALGNGAPSPPQRSEDLDGILVADLSVIGWVAGGGAPSYVGFFDVNGEWNEPSEPDLGGPYTPGARALPLAREPDLNPESWPLWSHYWTAQGGASVATECESILASSGAPLTQAEYSASGCEASHDASMSWNSLIDAGDDGYPADVEQGHLASLPNLSGATLRFQNRAGWLWHDRVISAHDTNSGRVDWVEGAEDAGWGRKYMVQNHFSLLDSPGEWWFDASTGLLYMRPLNDGHRAQLLSGALPLEVAFKTDQLFNVARASHIELQGLDVAFYERAASSWHRAGADWPGRSSDLTFSQLQVSHCDRGVELTRVMPEVVYWPGQEMSHVTLEGCYMHHLGNGGVSVSGQSNGRHVGARSVLVQGNTFYRCGLNQGAAGVGMWGVDRGVVVDNTFVQMGRTAVEVGNPVVLPSARADGRTQYFTRDERLVGEILVARNLVQDSGSVYGAVDAIAFNAGSYRDSAVRDNVLRYNIGRSAFELLMGANYIGEITGISGSAIALRSASGVAVYANTVFGARYGLYTYGKMDGALWIQNNVVAGAQIGAMLYHSQPESFPGGERPLTHEDEDMRVTSNLFTQCAWVGLFMRYETQGCSVIIDNNVYDRNGYETYFPGCCGDVRFVEFSFNNVGQVQDILPVYDVYHEAFATWPDVGGGFGQKPVYAVTPVNPDDWHVRSAALAPWARRTSGLEPEFLEGIEVKFEGSLHPASLPSILDRPAQPDDWLLPAQQVASSLPDSCVATPNSRAIPSATDVQAAVVDRPVGFWEDPTEPFPLIWSTAPGCHVESCDEVLRPCDPGSLCLQGQCLKQDGQPCAADEECLSNCVGGVCGTGCVGTGVWPSTPLGQTAWLPCAAPAEGQRSRACDLGGDWAPEADESACVTCPEIGDWAQGTVGQTATLQCGEGLEGEATRACTALGWELADFSACVDPSGGTVVNWYTVRKDIRFQAPWVLWGNQHDEAVHAATVAYLDDRGVFATLRRWETSTDRVGVYSREGGEDRCVGFGFVIITFQCMF